MKKEVKPSAADLLTKHHATILYGPRNLDAQLEKLAVIRPTVEDIIFDRAERYALHLDLEAVDRYAAAVDELSKACEAGLFDDPAAGAVFRDRVPFPHNEVHGLEGLREQAARMLEAVAPWRPIADAARAKGLAP